MPIVLRTTPTGIQQGPQSQLIVSPITNLTAASSVAGQIVLTWSGGAGYNVQYSYALSNGTIQSTSGINPTTITLTSTSQITTTVTLISTVLGGSTSTVSNSVTTYTVPAGLTDINSTSFAYPYTNPPITSNYGNNWTNTSITAGTGFFGSSCSANGQYAAFSQSSVGIWVSNDYGVNWTLVSNTTLSNSPIVVSSSGKYMYSINSTTIFYSSNYGVSFTSISLTSPGAPSVSFNEQYAFILSGSILYYSTNYGASFNTTTQFGTTAVISFSFSYTGAVQVVLKGTDIYVSLNFGSTWTTYASGFYALSRVRISADGKYMIGYGSTTSTTYGLFVGTWNGTGYTFTTTNVPTYSVRFSSISFTGQYMNIITFGSTFLYSNNYGVTWTTPTITTTYTIPTGIDFYAAAASSNGKYVIAGFRDFAAVNDILFESSDYGATYTQRTTITVTDASTYWAICLSADGIYQYATGTSASKTVRPIFSSG